MKKWFLFVVLMTILNNGFCSSDEATDYEEIGDAPMTLDDSPSETGTCGPGECSYVPHSPFIPCEKVWDDFIECDDPLDLRGNESARTELGYGCSRVSRSMFPYNDELL